MYPDENIIGKYLTQFVLGGKQQSETFTGVVG
jgi:hypothetical protein